MKPVQIGETLIRKFVEFSDGIPMPVEAFANLTAERLAELTPELDSRCFGPEPGTLLISMHTFVIETRRLKILVDTCNGNHKSRTGIMAGMNMLETNYLENLAALGLVPEEIDIVMCTHLHADHVGWNTKLENGQWVPTFPKAKYLMGKADVDYYGSLPANHPQAELARECYADSVLPVIDAGQAVLVEGRHVIEDGVGEGLWIEPAPGHTPGSCVLHAKNKHDHALFVGDIFHHPIQVQDPTLHISADNEEATALDVRRDMIGTYMHTGAQIFAAHFPEPTGGCIVSGKKDARFQFTD